MLLYFSCIFRSDSSSSLSSDSYLSLTRLKRSANKMGPLVLKRQRLQKTLLPSSVLLQSKSSSLSEVKESLLSLTGFKQFHSEGERHDLLDSVLCSSFAFLSRQRRFFLKSRYNHFNFLRENQCSPL